MYNNSSDADVRCTTNVLQGVGYSAVFIVGLVVNVVALRAFIAQRKSFTDTHIYMFNLVIADSTIVLSLPFRIYDAFFCWTKNYLCSFLLYVHYVNMYISILTVTAISVQRYLAVRFPQQFRLIRWRKRTACAVCLIVWTLNVIWCLIFAFRDKNFFENFCTCFNRCEDQYLGPETVVTLDVIGFLIPLVIIVFCSSQVIRALSKADSESDKRRRIIGVVTANMIVFIVCFTPIHVAFLVNFLHTYSPNDELFSDVSVWIATTNCCFDSISYYCLLRRCYSAAPETGDS